MIIEAEAQVTDKRCAGTMAEPPFSHHHVATARIHTPLPWGHLVDPLGLVAERTGTVAGRPCLSDPEDIPQRHLRPGFLTRDCRLPMSPYLGLPQCLVWFSHWRRAGVRKTKPYLTFTHGDPARLPQAKEPQGLQDKLSCRCRSQARSCCSVSTLLCVYCLQE